MRKVDYHILAGIIRQMAQVYDKTTLARLANDFANRASVDRHYFTGVRTMKNSILLNSPTHSAGKPIIHGYNALFVVQNQKKGPLAFWRGNRT